MFFGTPCWNSWKRWCWSHDWSKFLDGELRCSNLSLCQARLHFDWLWSFCLFSLPMAWVTSSNLFGVFWSAILFHWPDCSFMQFDGHFYVWSVAVQMWQVFPEAYGTGCAVFAIYLGHHSVALHIPFPIVLLLVPTLFLYFCPCIFWVSLVPEQRLRRNLG